MAVLEQLDESRLRKGFEIRLVSHQSNGVSVALIHVSRHPDDLVMMKADGVYVEDDKE